METSLNCHQHPVKVSVLKMWRECQLQIQCNLIVVFVEVKAVTSSGINGCIPNANFPIVLVENGP